MSGYLRTLLMFYKRHLRVQPLRELMAVAGVAAGVALLFAVQVAHHSITGSFEEIAHGVEGHATLEVGARDPRGFDARIAREVEGMGGVKAAAPILEQPIVAVAAHGRQALTLVGATEQIVPLGGRLAVRFQHAGETADQGLLVLTEATARAIGARRGSDVTILVGERRAHLTLAAAVPSSQLGSAAASPIAAAPLPVVQSVAALPGRVTRVLIEPRQGKQGTLRRALSRRFGETLNVRSTDTEARLLANAARPEQQVTLLFGAISLVAGMILAFNALLLAGGERRRFVVYLVEIGTPEPMIISSLVLDAFILGVAGSLLGLLVGDAVSLIAFRGVPGYIAAAFSVGDQRVVGVQTALIALAGGMVSAFAAAALPALAVLRASATDEREAVGRGLSLTRRLRASDAAVFGVGALIAALSVTLAAFDPSKTIPALVGLIGGLVLCLPMTARYLLELARHATQRFGDPAARLAIAELRTSPTRTVALLATGTVAAFLMVLIGGSVADVQRAAGRGATDLLSSATLWVKPGGPENVYTTQRFAYAQTQRRIRRLGVVSSVLPWDDSFLDVSGKRVWIVGVPGQIHNQIVPSQLVEGSLTAANRRLREGGWAALSTPIARERHLRIGDPFTLPTPAGTAALRLAATIANYGWLPGAVVLSESDHARLWLSSTTATELSVSLKPGVPIRAGKRAVEGVMPRGSALSVQSDSGRRAEVTAVLGSTLSRLKDTTFVVLIATVASVIALMLAAIWQRHGKLNSLMAMGMSPLQFARLVSYESGLVLLSGCIAGIGAGLLGQALIDGWLRTSTGASVGFTPAWQLALRTLCLAGGISVLASLIAVAQAADMRPRAAFSTD
jgi:putative ABC transport system permease protein